MKKFSAILAILAFFHAYPAWASPDFDTAISEEDKDYVCEITAQFARMIAEYRDSGKSEEEVLKATEETLSESGRGSKTRNAWRAVVKGAYVRRNERPSLYSAAVALACVDWEDGSEFKLD